MKKVLLLILTGLMLVSCGVSRKAVQEDYGFMYWLEQGYESEPYRQDSVSLVDARGDAHLIRQLDTIPVKLVTHLFKDPLPQTVTDKDKEEFKIGRTIPLDKDRLLNKCAEIMQRYAPEIIPHMGEEHIWSPEAKRYLHYGYWHRLGRKIAGKQKDFPMPMLMRSKLFCCLACGWTARYCITGQEQALVDRIMGYPDNSILPHHLFEESYLLNNGDIYMTMLTCENVLAAYPHRQGRENDPLQKKLASIRHDSKELGDNYGAWYHFFGTALYGMLRTRCKSVMVADTESLGSFLMEGPDRQETLINHEGALFGHQFGEMVTSGSWQSRHGPTDYMRPNPHQ